MPIKSVKMKISRFLGQKVCPVACERTDIQTWKWLLWAPFQGFRSFFFNLPSRIGPITCICQYNCSSSHNVELVNHVNSQKKKSIISENIDFERKWMFAYVLPQPNQNILLTFVLLVSWIKSNFQCKKKAHERSRFLVNTCER